MADKKVFSDEERWDRYNPRTLPELKSSIGTDWYPNKKLVRGYRAEDLILNATFSDMIFLLLFQRLPAERESRMFGAVMTTHCTGTYAATTSLAARNIITTNPDQHAAVAGGLLAMGFFHGGATQACAELIVDSVKRMKADGVSLDEMAKIVVAEHAQHGERIPGIGHPYFDTSDPRCDAIFQLAEELGFLGDHCKLYQKIADALPKGKKANLIINPEASNTSVMIDMLGVEHDVRAANVWHLLARVPSIAAGVLEEQLRAKRGDRRVPWKYDGPPERNLPDEYVQRRQAGVRPSA